MEAHIFIKYILALSLISRVWEADKEVFEWVIQPFLSLKKDKVDYQLALMQGIGQIAMIIFQFWLQINHKKSFVFISYGRWDKN